LPVDAKPLFRPDVLRLHLQGFAPPPPAVDAAREKLGRWAELIASGRADRMTERELLPDFLSDLFVDVLGYEPPPGRGGRYTLSREQHVDVDGQWADAALGRFSDAGREFVVAVEGKGPTDPLDRPFGGRQMSAVDQGYRYAINLPCDWVVITSVRQTRLYYKGANQHTYERFDTERLAADPAQLRRLMFLLGAERVLPPGGGRCHLYELLAASERAGRELTQQFYQVYAELRRDAFAALAAANAAVDAGLVLTATQKVLDRLLFCAFSEDRGLLPPQTIQRAYEHADPYNPRPIWDNFRGLFAAVNAGNPRLAIPRYNGGLFADDPVLDRMAVPDDVCRRLAVLGDYDYRPAHEAAGAAADVGGGDDEGQGTDNPLVDVDILGHIFEQSITDLERLRATIDVAGKGAAVASVVPSAPEAKPERNDRKSRRKREGAFYTPAFVTAYMVEQALGAALRERFEAVGTAARAAAAAADRANKHTPKTERALDDPRAYDLAKLSDPQRKTLLKFWEDWQAELGTVRVLDPSCGSGAFLVEAFDQLYAWYEAANDRLADLRGHRELFDPDRQILQNNLYGVDLNDEAVEICKLSLWIKTAERGKELTSLDATIQVGNSVVDDPAVHPRAFDWEQAFPEVFAAGGFDVVIGNPPYVRQELLSPIKPHLEARFASYHGMADLYVYFYELGLRVLRPGGRLTLVVTNKWLKAGYAEPLRRHLAESSWVESLVDFGHAKQIFEDADVFPCILVAKKPAESQEPPAPRVAVIPREQLRIEDLSRQIAGSGYVVERRAFGPTAWTLGNVGIEELARKLREVGVPLGEFCRTKPFYGIKTGLNDAFVIDTSTRDRIVAADSRSGEIIRPFLRGQDVDRWNSQWAGLWMIFARRGTDLNLYPAVREHLSTFRQRLEPKPKDWRGDKWGGRKGGAYKWHEIQDPVDYWAEFSKPKIVYQVIQYHPSYAFDANGMLGNDKTYFIPVADLWLLAVLNSPLMWWHNWRTFTHLKDEALSPMAYMVEGLPVAPPLEHQRRQAEQAVTRLVKIAKSCQSGKRTILGWLKVEYDVAKPTLKLQSPADLDVDAFVAEVKRARAKEKAKTMTAAALATLREEHARTIAPIRAQAAEALTLEQELSDLVNAAYGLTPDDVKLMWDTAPPRTPLAATAPVGVADR
jgi:hypothetical protein